MSFKIYNTKTKKIEDFIPNNSNQVNLYTCGPTVYHFAHIGNLRSYIMEDVLEKSLAYYGYNVKRCMNITDVGHLSSDGDTGDDKMLMGAIREKKSVMEIAKFYTNEFKKDCEKLNIKWPEIVVPATSCIDEYIQMVQGLINKDFAYIAGGNVYFDTSKLKNYYSLTNHQANDLAVGVRESVEEDANKKNKNDFVLWFTKSKFADQELKWESPWGYGYPGWHIECSAISLKYLGEHLDIHCGGVDNIFPHHTNEIAQSESYLGHTWCNYWFHVQHLNTEGGKMSKSAGGFTTVSSLEEKGYNPLAYRLFCLQSHYRNPLIFSVDRLDGAVNTYKKLLQKISLIAKESEGEINNETVNSYKEQFKSALASDLNTSLALTVLYSVIKDEGLNNASKLYLIKDFDKVLGLNLTKINYTKLEDNLKQYIEEQIALRLQAKKEKNYALADQIRNELLEKGITLKDTASGTEYIINE